MMNPASRAWQWLCRQAVLRAVRDRAAEHERLAKLFHPAPSVPEALESRVMLSVTPSLAGGILTFLSDSPSDALYLRTGAGGLLEYKTSAGGTYTSDLDPSSGVATLGTSSGVTILSTLAGTIHLDAITGGGGSFSLSTPGSVEIEANILTRGGALSLTAGRTLTIESGVTVSTRKVGEGTSTAGDLTLTAVNPLDPVTAVVNLVGSADATIDITGANVLGHDVTISAESAHRLGFVKRATSIVTVIDSTIVGQTVRVNAEADTSLLPNMLDNTPVPEAETVLDDVFGFTGDGVVTFSSARAEVTLGGASVVNANGEVSITADANSKAKPITPTTLISVAWADSHASAAASLLGGTKVSTAGGVKVNATTKSDVSATATADSLNKPVDLTLAYAKTTARTDALVGAGAEVLGGSVEISASSTNSSAGEAASRNVGGTSFGIAVTIHQVDAQTNAHVDGKVTSTGGDVTVSATTDTTDQTAAEASSLGATGSLGAKVTNAIAGFQRSAATAVGSKFTSPGNATKMATFLYPGIKSGSLNLAGSLAYAHGKNKATAYVAPGAVVNAHGRLTVTADVTDRVNISAHSKATSDKAALGGTLTLGNYDNDATAYVAGTVNATGATKVRAETRVPYPWQIDFSRTDKVLDALTGSLTDLLMTSFSFNTSSGSNGALAAAVNIFGLSNTATAYVAPAARVNQDATYANPAQTLEVSAKDELNAINVAGAQSTKILGAGAKVGIGGSANFAQYDSNAAAYVADDAVVDAAGDVTVKAETVGRQIVVTESAGSAQQLGVNGAASVVLLSGTTEAYVEDKAALETGGKLSVTATQDAKALNIAGGVVKAQAVGIGASVALGQADTTVRAFIGNASASDTAAPTGSVKAGAGIDLNATAGLRVDSYSLAGALQAPGTAGGTTSDSGSSSKGKFGFGASGAVSINTGEADAQAFIADAGTVSSGGALNLIARSTLDVTAVTGSAAISTSSNSAGLAGAYGQNELAADTAAYIESATVTVLGELKLESKTTGTILAIAASGSGAGKVGIAGAVTVNDFDNVTDAHVSRGAAVSATGKVGLTAEDDSTIKSLAGAVAGSGKASIGGSAASNDLGNEVKAYVDGASVSSGTSSVDVMAKSTPTIRSISAGGAGAGDVAVTGAVSVNRIHGSVDAHASGGATVTARGVGLTAQDAADIQSLSGQVAGAGKAAVGVAASYNQIADAVRAYASGATLTATADSVSIAAEMSGTITTVAAGVAGGGEAGVAGSVAINQLDADVEASIKGGSTVTANDSVGMVAKVLNTVDVYGGTITGGGTVGAGGSAAVTTLKNKVRAFVAGGSNVSAKGNDVLSVPRADGTTGVENVRGVAVVAVSDADVDVWTANLSGGGTVGVAATVSVTVAQDDTQAYVDGSTLNGANSGANAAQDVLVRAANRTDVDTKGGGLAIGGEVGVGGTADTVLLNTTTKAYVTSSTVRAADDVAVTTSTVERVNSIVVSGSGAGTAAVAGSLILVKSNTANEAYLDGAAVNAGGDLTVAASDKVYLGTNADGTGTGLIAGSLTIGGVAGVGGSVIYTDVRNTTRAHVSNSTTNASGTTAITAAASQHVKDYDASGNLGLYAGVGGSVVMNTIATTTQAYVEESGGGRTRLNLDAAFDSAIQDVKITAQNTSTMENFVGAMNAGIAGVGAAVDVSSVKGTITAAIGAGVEVEAGRDVTVAASSNRAVDSTVAAFSGGAAALAGAVTVINVGGTGSSKAFDALNGKGADLNKYVSGSAVEGVLGSDAEAATAKQRADAQTASISVSSGFDAGAAVAESTSATIGNGAVVGAGRHIAVSATSTDRVDVKVGAGSIGGLGVGGAAGVVTLNGRTGATVGQNAQLTAGGNVEVKATGTVTDTDVEAYAGAAGGVGLGAAVAYVSSDNDTTARIDDNAVVHRAADVVVQALGASDVHAKGFGAAIGSLAAGIVDANATETGTAGASVDAGAVIGDTPTSVQNATVNAKHTANVKANSTAATGGIIGSGNGSVATTISSPKATTSVGAGANVRAAGDVDVLARAISSSTANASGTSVAGGLAIGASVSLAGGTAAATVDVGGGAALRAGQDLTVGAFFNLGETGLAAGTGASATSSATAVALGSGTDATALVKSDADVTTTVGTDAALAAGSDLSVLARANHAASGKAYGNSGGLLTGGATTADVKAGTDATASLLAGADLTAGRDAEVDSTATTTATYDLTGGAGQTISDFLKTLFGGDISGAFSNLPSIASIGGSIVTLTVNNAALTDLANDATVTAARRADVTSRGLATVGGSATMTSKGALAAAATTLVDVAVDSDAVVRLHDRVRVDAPTVVVAADNQVDADATSRAVTAVDVGGAFGTGIIRVNVGTSADPSEARVILDRDVVINAPAALTLSALNHQGDHNLTARARATVDGGVIGTGTTRAEGTAQVRSSVDSGLGTKLTTGSLVVRAQSQYLMDRISDASATTIASRFVTELRTIEKEITRKVVEWLPWPLDAVVKYVTEKVFEVIEVVVQVFDFSTEKETTGGSGVVGGNDRINLRGDIYNVGGDNRKLTVNADGTVAPSSNVSGHVEGNDFVVDDVINDNRISLQFIVPNGTVGGDALIHLSKVLNEVLLENFSGRNLVVGKVQMIGTNNAQPDVTVQARNGDFDFPIANEITTGTLKIRNHTASDVVFTRPLNNYVADYQITNDGGDIVSTSPADVLEARNVSLTAGQGQIGTASVRLSVRLFRGQLNPDGTLNTGDSVLNSSARGPVIIDLTGVNATNAAFGAADRVRGLRLNVVSTRGDVDVHLSKSVIVDKSRVEHAVTGGTYDLRHVAAGGDVKIVANAGDLNVGSVIAGGAATLTASGAITDADNDSATDVTGTNVTLTATSGGIGSVFNALEIDSAGVVNAGAATGIYLAETAGDLAVGLVGAANGDVVLSAPGSIVDAASDASADVAGDNISLAAAGGIGSAAHGLEIDSSRTFAGVVNALSGGNIGLIETIGHMVVGQVTAGGAVSLAATAGAILDDSDLGTADITGTSATLKSAGGIAGVANPLETRVTRIEADAGTGGAWIANAGALTVGGVDALVGVKAGGPIIVTASSPIHVQESVVAGGDVTLTAGDSAVAGDDLTIDSGVTIESTGGSVTLRAGDDFALAAGSQIKAAGPVTIAGDFGNADAGAGTSIGISGSIHAASATLLGNADGDSLILTNVAAGTPTLVQTGGGDDVVHVRSIGAATTIDTGAGNDTVNLSSTAGLPGALAGNADAIDARLTIDGGTGDDAINVDDSTDMTGDNVVMTRATLSGPFGTAGTLTYGGIEHLDLALGSGSDGFTALDAGAATHVSGGAGDDTFRVGPVLAADGVPQSAIIDGVPTAGVEVPGASRPMTIDAGAGNDAFLVTRNAASLNLNGQSGDDTFKLSTAAGPAGPLANAAVQVDGGEGFDAFVLTGSLHDDRVTVTSDSADVSGGRPADFAAIEAIAVDGKAGNDTFEIDTTIGRGGGAPVTANPIGRVDVGGGDGDDSFALRGSLTTITTTLNGDQGADTFLVGSLAPVTVNRVAGPVIVWGDLGPDTLTVDDSGDAATNVGVLAASSVTGLGLGAAGVAYGGLETLNLNLGSGDDRLSVVSTHVGATNVNAGPGDDTIVAPDTANVWRVTDDNAGNLAGGTNTFNFASAENLIGGANADHFILSDGKGLAGRIDGRAGVDELDYSPYTTGVTVNLTAGSATNVFSTRPLGVANVENVTGGEGDDRITGDSLANALSGRGGADTLLGLVGDDAIRGDAGDDYAEGNEGNDLIEGGAGEDDLIGGCSTVGAPDGADTITGGAGHDVIAGDNAVIVRSVSAAGTFARYTPGTVAGRGVGPENGAVIRAVSLLDLDAIGGADLLSGGTDDDTILGGIGNDTAAGDGGNDDLIGHLGADRLDGGAGSDALVGDKGTIVTDLLDGSTARTITAQGPRLNATIDTAGTLKRLVTLIDGAAGSGDVLIGGLGDDSVHGGAGDDQIFGDLQDAAATAGGNDALFGDLGNDAVAGGAGSDHLYGGYGNDHLDGNLGADTAFGGDGSDTLVADTSADQLIDWVGNSNVFQTPSKGSPTIIRSPAPAVRDWLTQLAAADGAADVDEIAVLPPSQVSK